MGGRPKAQREGTLGTSTPHRPTTDAENSPLLAHAVIFFTFCLPLV